MLLFWQSRADLFSAELIAATTHFKIFAHVDVENVKRALEMSLLLQHGNVWGYEYIVG